MEIDELMWQTRIKITQAPVPFEPDRVIEKQDLIYEEPQHFRSFLYAPFKEYPPKTFGIELTANDKIDLVFFTKAKSKLEAIELGCAWLSNLKYKFMGLDGYVKAKLIKDKENIRREGSILFEIKLPNGLLTNKINIIERFISAFYNFEYYKTTLYILWQEEPKEEDIGKHQSPTYFLRIFVYYEDPNQNSFNFSKFKGFLRFLCMEIETTHLERAELEKPSDISIFDILEGNVFNNGISDSYIKTYFNFDFPEISPLPRLPILENENVRYIDVDKRFKNESLTIGKHVKNGVITGRTPYLQINKLPQDLTIFGQPGSGKTYFLAQIIEELINKAKNIGILVLNVAKESQEIYYKDFALVKYSDNSFRIPYFIEGKYIEKSLQETATYICASLGLKNVFEKIIYRVELDYLKSKGKLPDFLIELLKSVENYVENNPYGDDVQPNLMQALKNRINIFDQKHIQMVLKLSSELPKWIKKWLDGEKIYLDLSMCSKFTKLLIVNAIFQLIRIRTTDIEAEELKNLIVIDEAHAILEKPITTNSDDADFIMKEQMAKIFSELLKEYRSRGVGFIIADQSPSRLFDDVVSQPSIKVIFRQDYPNNLLFSEDPKERQMLIQLENRLALVINGATGEKYLMKTKDFTCLI